MKSITKKTSDDYLYAKMATWTLPLENVRSELLRRNVIIHSMVLYRRECLAKIRPYRPEFELAHDYDLFLRIADHYDVSNLPHILSRVRIRPSSLTATKFVRQYYYAAVARRYARERAVAGTDPVERGQSIPPPTSAKLHREFRPEDWEEVFQHYLRWGELCLDQGVRSAARKFFQRAIRFRPLSSKGWKLWLRTLLPSSQIERLVRWRHKSRF